jgi:hypothetical protein
MAPETIITAGAVVGAIGGIVAAAGVWGKKAVMAISRYGVNHLKHGDIIPDSYIGQQIDWNTVVDHKLDKIITQLGQHQLDIVKTHLLQLIHNTPEKVEIIEDIYSKYRELGGNSYICQVVEEWRDQYAKPIIHERVEKK